MIVKITITIVVLMIITVDEEVPGMVVVIPCQLLFDPSTSNNIALQVPHDLS